MPFDPKGIATQLVNEKLGGAGGEQGEEEGMDDAVHQSWKDLIEAIHGRDAVAAANIHRNIFQMLEAEPHDEYEEEGEEPEEEGMAYGGVAMPRRSVNYERGSTATGHGPLSTFRNPAANRFPANEHGSDKPRAFLKPRR